MCIKTKKILDTCHFATTPWIPWTTNVNEIKNGQLPKARQLLNSFKNAKHNMFLFCCFSKKLFMNRPSQVSHQVYKKYDKPPFPMAPVLGPFQGPPHFWGPKVSSKITIFCRPRLQPPSSLLLPPSSQLSPLPPLNQFYPKSLGHEWNHMKSPSEKPKEFDCVWPPFLAGFVCSKRLPSKRCLWSRKACLLV